MNLFKNKNLINLTTPFVSQSGHFVVNDISATCFSIAFNYNAKKGKYLLVASSLYKAQQIYSLLSLLVDSTKVALFPADEMIRAEMVAENNELSSARIYTLNQIINNEVDIVIASPSSFIRHLPRKELFISSKIDFKVGENIDIKNLIGTLVRSGYKRVNKIDQSMQFAIRGDIIDIFSLNYENPIRIELFDEEIESIRFFNIATQTSFEHVDSVYILSASDMLLDEKEKEDAYTYLKTNLEKEVINLSSSEALVLREEIEDVMNDLLLSNHSTRLYKYYSFFASKTMSLKDYCQGYQIIFDDFDACKHNIDMLIYESHEFIIDLKERHLILGDLSYYHSYESLKINNAIYYHQMMTNENDKVLNINYVTDVVFKDRESLDVIDSYLKKGYEVLLFLASNEQYVNIQTLLDNSSFKYEKKEAFELSSKYKIVLSMYSLPQGIEFKDEKIVILTSKELFKTSSRYYRYSSRYKEGTILKSYEELEKGDYVVHEYQGIGIFDCIETIEDDDGPKDFMKILYSDEDVLYVPLNQFSLVRKYLGKEGRKPKLSKLHSASWEKKKQQIKEKINDLANRLMLLYKERESVKGYAFSKDDEFVQMFEQKRPFVLTKDQENSLKEIKEDMESPFPMDRLLLGDVGFGKTEVAFTAAFKAINDGKQVAMLCPTTLLARQHFERAKERFAGFDVEIAHFSRLVSQKDQTKYMEKVEQGKIHLIIGTHRLLSKQIKFKDLGLLIVDEEQRFGVEQKERIKELKNNIDVLTLSATPIPRTLQISMVGMRSMSLINSAPKSRFPVQTYVLPSRNVVIKELIERELSRQGQVFYLHNKIATIYECANRIQKDIPNAKIGVAHGSMDKDEIEDVMMKFYSGDIDILVATSIIENGLDVPNANMIIVERADLYGLAQLYQIKGRVGRGDRIAYAYLLYNENKVLNEDAKKRLKAIKDFTALGSGYKIAQRDLLIRGAGDILGKEQAGFIDSIGLDMYIKLLNSTVKEKLNDSYDLEIRQNTSLVGDGYIPLEYAINEGNKFELYASIEGAKTIEELYKVKKDTIDVYGPLVEPVAILFDKQEVQIHIDNSKLDDLKIYNTYIMIKLGKEYLSIRGIGNVLFEKLSPFMAMIKITYKENVLSIRIDKGKYWINNLKDIIITLENIIKDKNG